MMLIGEKVWLINKTVINILIYSKNIFFAKKLRSKQIVIWYLCDLLIHSWLKIFIEKKNHKP